MLPHVREFLAPAAGLGLIFLVCQPARAVDWNVEVQIHEVEALANNDATSVFSSNPEAHDMYRKVTIEPVVGTGAAASCDNDDEVDVDKNHVKPTDWGCIGTVSGGSNTVVRVKIEIWDDDDPSGDDELDINPDGAQHGIDMRFEPATGKLTILGVPAFSGVCSPGRVTLSGLGPGQGETPTKISFTVTPAGDSDSDGLPDAWEACGVNADDDADIEINLKALGADPFRKDVFVEVDWMMDTNHSHEPWLPALINAWAEMDQAPLANPPNDAGLLRVQALRCTSTWASCSRTTRSMSTA